MIKTIQELNEKTKGFTKEQLKKFLDDLSEEEKKALNESLIIQHKINYVFKDDDFVDYTEDENELKERMSAIKETISNYNQKDLYYTKESIYNPYILNVLAHCIKDTTKDLDEERLNHLIDKYNEIHDFINNNKNYNDILETYGDIVNKDDKGFYILNDAITNKILKESELNIKDDDDLTDFKDTLNLAWDNKKEILDYNEINNKSEETNGINFKEFIFCEEYIKRGKIKPTCEHLGISRNTAYLWLKDDKIQTYLNNRREEIKKETDNTFLQTYRESFNQLNNMITSKYLDSSEKIKAIDTFLKHYENIERLKQPNTTYED